MFSGAAEPQSPHLLATDPIQIHYSCFYLLWTLHFLAKSTQSCGPWAKKYHLFITCHVIDTRRTFWGQLSPCFLMLAPDHQIKGQCLPTPLVRLKIHHRGTTDTCLSCKAKMASLYLLTPVSSPPPNKLITHEVGKLTVPLQSSAGSNYC